MKKGMNPYLLLARPLFELAKWFKECRISPDAIEQLKSDTEGKKNISLTLIEDKDFRQRVENAFSHVDREAVDQQLSLALVQEVKYALSALIDELVMCADWQHSFEWMAAPLQMKLFGEHLAGEGFFDRLTNYRQKGDVDVLEIFYLCLQFGFTGKYHEVGDEKLKALQVDLRSQIDGLRGPFGGQLSPNAVPRESSLRKGSRELPLWVFVGIFGGFLLTVNFGFNAVMEYKARQVVSSLHSHHKITR